MPAPRTAILLAVGLALAVIAILMWPRGGEIAEWTQSDLERPADEDTDPGDLTAQRIEAEPDLDPPREALVDAGDPARTLTLRGRVVDARGTGVRGASVQLELRGAERERVRKPVLTGADGTFAFRGPLRGARTVSVLAEHPDFAPSLVDRSVPASVERDELPLGDITLGRGARVRGSVTRPDGSALPGASVDLSPESSNRVLWSRDGKRLLPAQVTDGTGSFEFTRVPPGAYRAVARATRMVAKSSETFAVAEGNDATIEPIALQPGTLLRGLVTDRAGRGIENAQVSVVQLAGAGPQQRTATDAAGRFELDHLRPRASELRVFAPGHVVHRTQIDLGLQQEVTIALDAGLRLHGRVRDAASGEPVETFAVQARRLRGLREPVPAELAHVAREDLQRQLTEAHRALRDLPDDSALIVRIATLQRALQAHADAASSREQANPAPPQDPGAMAPHPGGTFVLEGLDEGEYTVDVKASDHMLARSESVELRVGREAPELLIALQRGLTVRGLVVRADDGRGIARARVELMALPPEAAATRRLRGPTIASTTTDDGGAFTLRNVRPGRCATHVVARGFETTTGTPFVLGADVDDLRLTLAARASLHGRVRGVPAGREGEVNVIAFASQRNVSARALGAHGEFRLEELAPGSYHVRAFLADASTGVRRMSRLLQTATAPAPDVVLQPGEDRQLDIDLSLVPAGSLRGVVRVNGTAASGYQVQLVGEGPAPADGLRHVASYAQQIEAGGMFAFDAVEPAAYELRVHSIARDRIEIGRQRVQVLEGRETTVAVDITTASLEGEVAAPEDGKPLDGVIRLRPRGLRDEEPSERPQESRDITVRVRGGRFRADVLPSGSFTLELRAGAERDVIERDVDLAAGARAVLVLKAGALKEKD